MQNNDPRKDVHVLMPGPVNMLTYMAEKDIAAVINLRILRWKLPGESSVIIATLVKVKRGVKSIRVRVGVGKIEAEVGAVMQ